MQAYISLDRPFFGRDGSVEAVATWPSGFPWASRAVSQPMVERIAFVTIKRATDILVCLTMLLLVSPLLMAIALAVKIDSAGPVLFRQKRVGIDGKDFSMLKFRSMRTDAPTYAYKPQDSYDPRITRVGRFLRRSSLDELPQLINVLRGDMSLVGPRPEMPFIVAQYKRWQHRRHLVRPGITGWWQVRGRHQGPMHEHTELDVYYVENQSLWLDIRILWSTFTTVVRGAGAV